LDQCPLASGRVFDDAIATTLYRGKGFVWPPEKGGVAYYEGLANRSCIAVAHQKWCFGLMIVKKCGDEGCPESAFQSSNEDQFWKRIAACVVIAGEPLAYREMEVDHILPIELERDQEARTARFTEVGISDDFDLNSLVNLVPACRKCNNSKRNLALPSGRIAIMLAHSAYIEPKIHNLIEKYVRQADGG
jgi:HNH endonuclease